MEEKDAREVCRLQGGDGENEQWRRAERETLIQAHRPTTGPPFGRKDGGLRGWKKKMRTTKAEGK